MTHSSSEARGAFDNMELQTVSVSDAVYGRLQEAITEGRLEPGTPLKEAELSKEFGVSRTPMREALQRLAGEGYLTRRAAGPFTVAAISTVEAGRLVDVREALEGVVARQLALMVSSGELGEEAFSRVKSILHEMDAVAGGSSRSLIRLGYDFHLTLASLTGNRTLQRFLEQTIGSLGRYRYILWDHPERRIGNVDAHWRILEHICAGDDKAAEREMREHIVSAKEAYMRLIETAGTLAANASGQ